MLTQRQGKPYIWITAIAKLLAGEANCEWAAWLKAHYRHTKHPSDFDSVAWQMNHTKLLNSVVRDLEDDEFAVSLEKQNSFSLEGDLITLGGRPDVVAIRATESIVADAKTGQPHAWHAIQVMLAMYALPLAIKKYAGRKFRGMVVYPDSTMHIPADKVNKEFVRDAGSLLRRITGADQLRKVPSFDECRYCDITPEDCPDRISTDGLSEPGIGTDLF